jgi:hypothetical protein
MRVTGGFAAAVDSVLERIDLVLDHHHPLKIAGITSKALAPASRAICACSTEPGRVELQSLALYGILQRPFHILRVK